ncbi:MAG: glycosyltransferase family 4 protein [bacterium]
MGKTVMPIKVAYVHNVCMPYKVPLLSKISGQPEILMHGFFGQSHWKNSKLYTIKDIKGFPATILPTLNIVFPYKGRGLHLFWNPTLFKALCRFHPNVIVAGNSNFPNNITVALYARRFNIPYIWHGIGSMYDNETPLRRFFSIPLVWFFTNANAGIAFNTTAKNYFIRRFALPSENIFVAPNLVDTRIVESERRRFSSLIDAKRRDLGLQGMKTILFVGVLEPSKRVDCLIRAFAMIREKVPDAVLVIVGDGSSRRYLEKLAAETGPARIIFLGRHLADANLYFMLGDIFVLPGLGGLAISQAMSHGLPVISARADGTEQDLITNGKNGFVLSGPDPIREICKRLEMLLLDDDLRIRMGQESRRLISERFNIDNTAMIFTRALRSVLK